MSTLFRWRRRLVRPHLWLIAVIGVIVPRRLRADWRQEWEAELRCRERRLADWDRLDARQKWDLLRRSSSAFWDALWLQPQRREDEMVQDLRFGFRMLIEEPDVRNRRRAHARARHRRQHRGLHIRQRAAAAAAGRRAGAGAARPGRAAVRGRAFPSDSTYPDYLDYRDRNTVLSGLAATSPRAFHLRAGSDTERVEGELVSTNYFDVLGVDARARPAAFAGRRERCRRRLARGGQLSALAAALRRRAGDGRAHDRARRARVHRHRRGARGVCRHEGRKPPRCVGADRFAAGSIPRPCGSTSGAPRGSRCSDG